MTDDDLEQRIAAVAGSLTGLGHPETTARLVEALTTVWRDLDATPRTDPFWSRKMNHRATEHKVAEYARLRFAADPEDRTAALAAVALDVHRGANDGGLPHLAPAIRAGDPAAARDAVVVAQWVHDAIGLDNTGLLRRLLRAAPEDHLEPVVRDILAGATLDEAQANEFIRRRPA